MALSLEQNDNVRFAEVIEQYPCLYDYAGRTPSSRTETEKAWKEISIKFGLTVRECKLRWKNIRTVFRRHLFGSVGVTPKKHYYLSDTLHFMIPLMKASKKPQQDEDSYDGHDADYEVPAVQEQESQDVEPEPERQPLTVPSEPEIILSDESEMENHSTLEATQPQVNSVRERKSSESPDVPVAKRQHSTNTENENSSVGTYGNDSHYRDELSAKSDELFLLSLKDDMRMMNPLQKRKFKRRIFEVIDEILMRDNFQQAPYDPSKVKEESELMID